MNPNLLKSKDEVEIKVFKNSSSINLCLGLVCDAPKGRAFQVESSVNCILWTKQIPHDDKPYLFQHHHSISLATLRTKQNNKSTTLETKKFLLPIKGHTASFCHLKNGRKSHNDTKHKIISSLLNPQDKINLQTSHYLNHNLFATSLIFALHCFCFLKLSWTFFFLLLDITFLIRTKMHLFFSIKQRTRVLRKNQKKKTILQLLR